MSQELRKVALVDDDPTAADMMSVLLEDVGYEAIDVQPPIESIDDAIAQIRSVASAAICDHRLSPRGLANFSGAELVSQLYDSNIPAVLISQYCAIDQNVSIRKYRSKIPILLPRDDLGPDQLANAIKICENEIAGQRLPSRRGWRTLVRVVAKDLEGSEEVVDAIVPGWRPNEAVRFPADLLGSHQDLLPEGPDAGLDFRFSARVNLGAENSGDLYFENFHPAKEPRNDNIPT